MLIVEKTFLRWVVDLTSKKLGSGTTGAQHPLLCQIIATSLQIFLHSVSVSMQPAFDV